ncbi:hypothetical protein B5V02_18085 [Mesorhizobium kowhaii]|uniref:Uncharacterized protein n=1 Tax=Mesorhizobium kowhaii TaxID=1300272 RepID=A0A2W7C448_9HYPH|nr:hypothetical protein B5V02_18085 [Mesorhizobium kowhaii]
MVGQVTGTVERPTAQVAQLVAVFVILFGTANRSSMRTAGVQLAGIERVKSVDGQKHRLASPTCHEPCLQFVCIIDPAYVRPPAFARPAFALQCHDSMARTGLAFDK